MTKIKESGLINKLKAEYWPRPSFCSTGMQTEAKPVSLRDVQGAYYVMAMLLALATASLLTEKMLQFARLSGFTLPTLCFWRRQQRSGGGHSGGYLDEKPTANGDVSNGVAGGGGGGGGGGGSKYRYSDYFADFVSQQDTHEMRSVRYQSQFISEHAGDVTSNGHVTSNVDVTSNGDVAHVTSNGDVVRRDAIGSLFAHGNFWTYESVRNNNVYTYNDTDKTVV